jgi:opacity protein-like surface antigen
MKIIRFTLYVSIILSLIVATSLVSANESVKSKGNFFMGIKYGDQNVNMQSQFTRRVNGTIVEESGFDNEYTANAAGLFFGYTLFHKQLYLSSQIFFDTYGGEFDLSAGSSRFTNTLNNTFGIDLMPGVYLYRGLSVFAKLGLASGNFDFVKSSPTSTNYDVNERLYGYTLGLGLAYDITQKFTAKIGYDNTRYQDTTITANRGVLEDKTVVEPRVDSFFLTLQYNFN